MKLLKAVITFIAFQLLIAYINWDINPANWDNLNRAGGAMFGIVLAVGIYAIITINEEKL